MHFMFSAPANILLAQCKLLYLKFEFANAFKRLFQEPQMHIIQL